MKPPMPPPPRARTGPKPPGSKPPGSKPPAGVGSRRRAAATPSGGVLGGLDRVDPDGTIEGWCWSPDHPLAHRTVAVTIDGHVVARAAGNRARRDLAEAGRGEGDHGFLLRLAPSLLRAGATAEIALRDVATGQLVGTPRQVTWGNAASSGAAVATHAGRAILSGHLDRVTRDGWVSGWCWDPQRPGRTMLLDVLVDGQVVGTTQASNWRGDLQQAGVGDGCHGFSYALPYEVMAGKGTLRIAVRESGGTRLLGDPLTLRIGLRAQAEERVAGLERQIRLLRGKLDALERQAAQQPEAEERAARALFGTVAAFFRDLADGTPEAARSLGPGRSLQVVRDELAARLPALTLRRPDTPDAVRAVVIVSATEPVEMVHRCLADLHAAGADRNADLVVLDPGEAPENAFLPSLVRGLRYEHCNAETLPAACNAVLQRSAAPLAVLVDPRVSLLAEGWRALLAGFAGDSAPVLLGGSVIRGDGLLQHAGLVVAGGRLRELAQFAEADRSEHRFLRPVDALAPLALAMDRRRVVTSGGFDPGFRRLGHATVALCVRLAGQPGASDAVLLQPAAAALWNRLDADPGQTLPDTTGSDEDARRLRLTLVQGDAEALRARGFVGHALVVDDRVPQPDRDAGSVAAATQMQVLRRLGWHVTFAPATGAMPEETDRRALESQGVEVALPPQHESVAHYLQAAGADLDLVQIVRYPNFSALAPVVRELAPRAKLLFAPADLHYLRAAREAAMLHETPDPTLRREQRGRELLCVREADATLLHSDHEQSLLAAEVETARLAVLRWIARPNPAPPGFAGRDGALFVGNFSHRPNVDAVLWFAREVMPLLRKRRPGLVLHVVGSDPPPEIAEFAGLDLVVHGWVRDLPALLATVRLGVVPLRFGAGFKGKIATTLAEGVPVVGTPMAFEGTGLADGDGIAIARQPADFVRLMATLHDDSAQWNILARRAVERVGALYSPDAAADVYRQLLARLGLPFR